MDSLKFATKEVFDRVKAEATSGKISNNTKQLFFKVLDNIEETDEIEIIFRDTFGDYEHSDDEGSEAREGPPKLPKKKEIEFFFKLFNQFEIGFKFKSEPLNLIPLINEIKDEGKGKEASEDEEKKN